MKALELWSAARAGSLTNSYPIRLLWPEKHLRHAAHLTSVQSCMAIGESQEDVLDRGRMSREADCHVAGVRRPRIRAPGGYRVSRRERHAVCSTFAPRRKGGCHGSQP